ncbi:uncharacterized protein LOC127264791 [Andrographis paniculata]|uniref:uncharacterized protein LOC127264791 n=1 Tax=Andrographis paniculata TaxID=175694 RepID=UPI0021E7D79F|nr:uncharacterized protein LOC127264791 [Andrographis paniculata]
MPKLLGELLQEQQEPFVLEAYLLERGYLRSIKILESCSLKKRMHLVPHCTKFIKSVVSHRMIDDNTCMIKSTNGGWMNSFVEKWTHKYTGKCRLSVSSSTAKSKYSVTKRGRDIIAKEVTVEKRGKWGSVEESKQLSPISVLQETESDEGSPINQRKSNFKASSQGESSASISQNKAKQQLHYSVQGLPRIIGSDSYSQYIINKKAMKQTKQLLIDCVREVIEYCRERDIGREQIRKILGAEEVWKLVCEKVWEWSQEPIDENNTVHLLYHDFLVGVKREDSEQQSMEISKEIEEAILADVIHEMLFC